MTIERSLEDIKNNSLRILENIEKYRVVECQYNENFEIDLIEVTLTLKNVETSDLKKLSFSNVRFKTSLFFELKDACGIYIINTKYLGYNQDSNIEVGDWDSGPPIFWAENVEVLE